MDDLLINIILFGAALFGGAMNAVAGGGSFFAFPALLLTGAPAVAANATCTIALWPGAVTSIFAYRKQLRGIMASMIWMILIGCIGGWVGAMILLNTPDTTFESMIPWLLLIATIVFAYGKHISGGLAAMVSGSSRSTNKLIILSTIFQIIIAIYGGFFGAGIGILTLAMLQLTGMQDMHQMNAKKVVIASSINASAFVTFILSGIVLWQSAFVMIVGGILGGYLGAHLALKLPQHSVRRFVICVASLMTCYFFIKYYLL